MSGVEMVVPGTAVKWKIAIDSSRVLENPSTDTLSVLPVRAIAEVVIVGTAGAMVICTGVTLAGVTFTPFDVTTSEMVAVPATVPVWICTVGVTVDSAGILQVMVRRAAGNRS